MAAFPASAHICPDHAPPAGLARITEVMATGRFVAYVPTSMQVINGVSSQADQASILEDLRVLRPRFDGLITYRSMSGEEFIPVAAAQLGYRAVIMGVWDPANTTEIANVLAAAQRQPGLVVGVSLGNETVFGKRRSFDQLAGAMTAFRKQAPGLAIATTEPFYLLLEPAAAAALRQSDILLANVHPVFEPWFRNAPDFNAAEFVTNVTAQLGEVYCGPILVKETGVPTAPTDKGFTPERQASFYQALKKQFLPGARRAFAYFSAFDAPWRAYDAHPVPGEHPEEAHWGLYDELRQPKPVVGEIPLLDSQR